MSLRPGKLVGCARLAAQMLEAEEKSNHYKTQLALATKEKVDTLMLLSQQEER